MTATQIERLNTLYYILKTDHNVCDQCLDILQSVIDEEETERSAQKKKADGWDIQKLGFL